MSEKPEALRLAEDFESLSGFLKPNHPFYHRFGPTLERKAAAELRRLHAENERLREVLMRLQYDFKGHIKRHPSEEEVIAALRREDV